MMSKPPDKLKTAKTAFDASIDCGITFIDTAEVYGSRVLEKDRKKASTSSESASRRANITIGGALEAIVVAVGNKAVDYSDATTIQATEVRAIGRTNIIPGGVAAAAQSAVTRNARLTKEEEKTKLAEILAEASSKLPSDKPVTRKDADGVISAKLRNDPNLCTRPGGVAASIVAASGSNKLIVLLTPLVAQE